VSLNLVSWQAPAMDHLHAGARPRPRSSSPAPSWSSSALGDPAARYADFGPGYYQTRLDTSRKLRNHMRQIQALGFEVALTRPGSPYGP
jgi:hypothetical protein